MRRETIIIVNKLGLHARAAAKFVKLAATMPCEVKIGRSGREVNGKSIMGVMMLAAGLGAELSITTDGSGEDRAMGALLTLIRTRFGEDE